MNAGQSDVDDRLIGAIRAIDPYPDEVAGPPSELVMRRLRAGDAGPSAPARSWLPPLAAVGAVTVAVAVAAVAVVLLGHNHASSHRSAAGQAGASRACRSGLHFGVLPVWARAGFSARRPREDFVVGRRGRIGAILFGTGDYLVSPPAADHANKILWVSRVRPRSGDALTIHAQRMRGATRVGAPVTRAVIGGPGPSIINLPEAGCWRLTLRWADWSDQIDLSYTHPG